MVRVLHVLGKMDRGGAETLVMSWYRAIDRSKVQFDFMVHTQEKAHYDDEILSLGGRIYRVPRFKGYNVIGYRRAWKAFFREHTEYSIMHGHIRSSAAFYMPAGRKSGLLVIAHSHNTDNGKLSLKETARRVLHFPMRWFANVFFGCSMQACIDSFGKVVAGDSSRCRVINNAIDTVRFAYDRQAREAIRDEFNIQDRFVVGTVGRIAEQKSPERIVDIFKAVREKEPGAVLLWVGTGEMEDRIKDRVEKEGLGGVVVFAGVRTDVPALLSAMDVFLLPSLWEGLSVAIVEAQASGLPCVASEASGNEASILKELVYIMPLTEPPEKWSEVILRCTGIKRMENCYERVAMAGFDVFENAKWLQGFYLDATKPKGK